MEKIFSSLSKFWFPVMCIIAGGLMLISSLDSALPQPTGAKLGAACILIVGIVSLLFLLDVVRKPVRMGLLFVSLLGSAYLMVASSNSITVEMAERKEAKLVKDQTVQALKDVRTALESYRSVNGKYTQDLDELTRFVQSGTLPKIMKIGALPDTIPTEEMALELGLIQKMPAGMTAQQATDQGLIIRDTIQIAVMEDKFMNDIAKKGRVYPFDVKNIKFAPYSQKAWLIKAGFASMGGVQQPVVEVSDPSPFKDEKVLKIGDLNEAHLNGNWDND